jgi:hypothetical protein
VTYYNGGMPSSDILEKYEPGAFEVYSKEDPSLRYLDEQKGLLRLVYFSEGLSATESNYQQEENNTISGVLIYEITPLK